MELPLPWMVVTRSHLERRLREPSRAPEKIFREIRQFIRQGDPLRVRQLAALAPLHLEQKLPLDRVDVRLVCGFEPLAVALLFFGRGEGHPVTLPSARSACNAGNPGKTGIDFIDVFRLLRRRNRPPLTIPGPLILLGFSGVWGRDPAAAGGLTG